jgi:hypothetical protein
MELIINDLPQYGVLIHGPESPGYRERLLALPAAFTAPPDIDDDELRYSVIVENQTPQHILEISLTWSLYPRESGTPISQSVASSNRLEFNNLSRSLIPPGAQCAWSALDGLWFKNRNMDYPTGGDSRRKERDHVKKRLEANDKWSVDIDCVLFSDGVFAGPDTYLQFDQLEVENRGRVDMIAELNRKLDDGEDAFAYAEQCASIPWEQIIALYPDPRLSFPAPPRAECCHASAPSRRANMGRATRKYRHIASACACRINPTIESHFPNLPVMIQNNMNCSFGSSTPAGAKHFRSSTGSPIARPTPTIMGR